MLVANHWYCFRANFCDVNNGNYFELFVDGIKIGEKSLGTAFVNPATDIMYIGSGFQSSSGSDCYIGRVFVTNNPDAKEIWTAFGYPLHQPKIIRV